MGVWMTFRAVVFLVTQQFSLYRSQVNPTVLFCLKTFSKYSKFYWQFFPYFEALRNSCRLLQETFTTRKHWDFGSPVVTCGAGETNVCVLRTFSRFFSGRFVNTYTCVYCVLYCLYCAFVLFRLCIFILICFVSSSVRTTATEWQLNWS